MDCAYNIITANFSGGKTHATTARVYQWSRGIELCITGADNLPQTFKAHFSVQKKGGVATTIVGIDERVTVPNVLFTIGKDIHVWLGASETEDDAEILYTVDIPVAPAPMPEYYDAEDTGVFDAVVEQVSGYAATATAAANSAGASATAAAGSASAAAASASSAAGSAGAAEQAKADAVTAKGQAETAAQTATEKAQQSAQNASQAASDAGRAESAAERAESAESGAGAAKTAAEAAAQSAAASAATADEKATLAGQSATAAAGSASAAAQSAASIEGDVQIASRKAAEAQTAAGQAVTAKDAAVTAQTAAETAATNAGQSASTATAKAAEAATSASNAAASESAAEAAATRAEQAAASLTVDDELSSTSTNPVQNKVIDSELIDVKSAIDAFAFEGKYYADIAWEDGTISDGSSEAPSSTRKRTKNFISFSPAQKVKITVPSGKRIYGWYYPAPDYADHTSLPGAWHTTDFELTVDASKYYKFIISDNPEGSTRVSESGFAFELEPTIYHQLDEKIDGVGDTLDSLFADGNNLFDPETAVEKHALSTTGASTSNKAYWHTDYIDCDGVDILLFPPNSRVLRFCWYSAKSESSFVSYAQGVEYVKKPSTARYIRIAFYNANTAFADRYGIMIVGYGKNPAFETYEVLNSKEMVVRDGQYFFVDRGDYSTSFEITINRGNQGNKNMIVSFHGYYTGNSAPTISFAYPLRYDTTNMYFTSQTYTMGNALFPDVQEWRLPAFPLQATVMRATVTIPSGTTLHIEHLYNRYDDVIDRNVRSYKLSAHLGTPCIYPNNTMLSFNSAAKLGYPGCVTVPKRTSDGMWVCFHDDSNVGDTLRNPDGTALSSSDAAKSISDFTYAELLAFSAGAKKSMYYAGEKVPTLEAFFALCQRTGMAPILSTHPNPDASGWAEIKALADRYNVTGKLVIKGGSIVSCLAVAHEVFGDEIGAYIVDVSDSTRDAVTELDALGWTLNHARLGIEYFDAIITQAKVTEALTAGYAVACFIQYGTAARYKELLAMGVTDITDDNNCSFGLNW